MRPFLLSFSNGRLENVYAGTGRLQLGCVGSGRASSLEKHEAAFPPKSSPSLPLPQWRR